MGGGAGIQNNMKICDNYSSHISQPRSSSGNFYGLEIQHGIFFLLNFGPGIFLGFVWSTRDFGGGGDFDFCPPFDYPCNLKSTVPPGYLCKVKAHRSLVPQADVIKAL